MLFLFIMQVIDSFHYKNHTDPECKVKFNPSVVQDKYPNVNLMCCEQTFIWLSRYKKIVCAMSKNHHLFFLHRIIKRRNEYTEFCHNQGRKPLLPKTKDTGTIHKED